MHVAMKNDEKACENGIGGGEVDGSPLPARGAKPAPLRSSRALRDPTKPRRVTLRKSLRR